MAFKRAGSEPPPQADDDVKIVDELVKKSLAVNPKLRRGQDTSQIVEGLRAEVKAKARAMARERAERELADEGLSDTAPAAPEPSTAGGLDPRLQSIDIFLRDKSATFPEEVDSIERKIEALRQEIEALRQSTTNEIEQLVGALVGAGADPRATQDLLRRYPDLWTQLKTSSEKVFQGARKGSK